MGSGNPVRLPGVYTDGSIIYLDYLRNVGKPRATTQVISVVAQFEISQILLDI